MTDIVPQNLTQNVIPTTTPEISGAAETKTITIPAPGQPLGQQLALELLCRGVRMAQSRGAFQLEEASLFLRAINEFIIKKE